MREYLKSAFTSRPCKHGPPYRAAMRARLRDRSAWRCGACPTLDYTCDLCEAEFRNRRRFSEHVEKAHGGQRWYAHAFAARAELEPYIPTPTESRAVVRRFAQSQQFATCEPENEPYQPRPSLDTQESFLWAELFQRAAAHLRGTDVPADVRALCEREVVTVLKLQARCVEKSQGCTQPPLRARRAFTACVVCAMMSWSETLYKEYIAGPSSTIPDRAGVADLLDVERYKSRWPDIPTEELVASCVGFPFVDDEGNDVSKEVLLHKRRVPEAALKGEADVPICAHCRSALWKPKPTLPKMALANDLWLGRHPPLLRRANLAHQLLLALGRVVSTKVYLSSKGGDIAVRQERESWRQKFLQYGMKGTAIVFGNGRVDEAMESFPPEPDVVKDTFVAVFSGPEDYVVESCACLFYDCQIHARDKALALMFGATRAIVHVLPQGKLPDKRLVVA